MVTVALVVLFKWRWKIKWMQRWSALIAYIANVVVTLQTNMSAMHSWHNHNVSGIFGI